jgi:transposase
MSKRKNNNQKRDPKPKEHLAGSVSRSAGQTLTSYRVGALPFLDQIIERAKIPEILRKFVVEDKRCTISPVVGICLLLKNYLVSREPIYGVGDWARQYLPRLLGLRPSQVSSLNDDRVGRCLNRLFNADCAGLVLAITRQVIEEFHLDLEEIHNDSTTITFYGSYPGAAEETRSGGRKVPAITWGHNKDHRGDLKQLLFNLTVTADGSVPVAFGIENGNVTDDQTHRGTWELLCKLAKGVEFLYVADSKLATRENMAYIANRGGHFLSVLPRSRAEDKEFRERLARDEEIPWEKIEDRYDELDRLVDAISVANEPTETVEGYRLLWFHSTRKVGLDRTARNKSITRAHAALRQLHLKLQSPRTHYRQESKVAAAVQRILSETGAAQWVQVRILVDDESVFVQERPGRSGANTRYRKVTKNRFKLRYATDDAKVEESQRMDGIFPLVTNKRKIPAAELLAIYKRQSLIEKRFAQLKSQYEIAPVFLKAPHRVVALLTIYYLALLVQSLVERQIREAMKREGIESLPLYYEERECKAPTTRRLIDLFDNIQHHELAAPGQRAPLRFGTEISELQREILRLLGVSERLYAVK